MRAFGCAFFLVLVFSDCREGTLKLKGDFSSVQKALDLAPDKTVSGEISGDSPVYFRIRLSEPQMLRAELSAVRGIDTSLAVLDANQGVIMAADDNGSSLPEEIFPVFLGAGEFHIRLSGKGSENSTFTFFYRLFKPPADVEREPNNNPETANVLGGDHAVGFYGPEFTQQNGIRKYEQDCFSKELSGDQKNALALQLTGVDGIRGYVAVFDAAGKQLIAAEATEPGSAITAGPVALPASGKFFICVAARKIPDKASKDYYELKLNLAEATQLTELEPNNTEKTANTITADRVDGLIADAADSDFFRWKNRREYAVYVRAEFTYANPNLLKFLVQRTEGLKLIFEDSAPGKEIAENLRVEPGEEIILGVRARDKISAKKFQAQSYSLKLKEAMVTDEGENEQNDTADKADTLVDLTQKWGFINPMADADYYKIQASEDVFRTLIVESKLGCKVRLEHTRDGKPLASQISTDSLRYNATFRKNDLLKLNCLGQKKNPQERAYRIALTE